MASTDDCATCRFFFPKDEGTGGSGDCRRHAPVVTTFTESNGLGELFDAALTSWPQVGEAQWCGDFEPAPDPPDLPPPYRCEECHDGCDPPKATWPEANRTDSVCPKCGELCIPF